MVGDSDQNYSSVSIGGGTNKANAVTQIKFYTAANTESVTGTVRMLINESGNVGIGTESPSALLHLYTRDRPQPPSFQNGNGPNLGAEHRFERKALDQRSGIRRRDAIHASSYRR